MSNLEELARFDPFRACLAADCLVSRFVDYDLLFSWIFELSDCSIYACFRTMHLWLSLGGVTDDCFVCGQIVGAYGTEHNPYAF